MSALVACRSELDVLGAAAEAQEAAPPGPSPFTATSITAGQYHTCAISRGSVYCWGENVGGALGTGDTDARSIPARVGIDSDWVEVIAGDRVTCARRLDASVWCWGENLRGEAAQSDLAPRLEPAPVTLPAGAVHLSVKFKTACALLEDRSLHCWGDDFEGQLGDGDPFTPEDQPTPTPTRVALDNEWTGVDTGQGHVCAIAAPGDLWCWGRNVSGELGLGVGSAGQIRAPTRVGTDSNWTAVSAGQLSTCGIRLDSTLWCWGDDEFGQLGIEGGADLFDPTRVGAESGWTDVSVNTFGACAIREGALYCWGRNDEGQLGLGDNAMRETPTRVDTDSDWVDVESGRFHTCARRADASVWCTGENRDDGRLGVGDYERRNVFTAVTAPSMEPQ